MPHPEQTPRAQCVRRTRQWGPNLTRRLRVGLVAWLLLGAGSIPAWAAVDIQFPLDGFYRPGKYFPVRVTFRGEPAGMLRLGADGAVATELAVGGQDRTVVVPMLAISSSLQELHAFAPSGHSPAHIPNLIALTDEDRLVAMVGDETIAAQMLFSGKNIWPVQLDPSGPLFAPIAAWQALDGVVLDATTMGRLTQGQLASLLAGGTVVAINGGNRPAGPWHWERVGSLWVASRPDAGPDDVVQPDAYSPSFGWQTQFDATLRWQVFVAAAIFSALMLGLLLLQPRGMTAAGVVLAVMAVGGSVIWHGRQSTTQSLYGSIFIRGSLAVMHDQWSWHAVLRPETVGMPFRHLLRPVFYDDHQPAETQIHLQCDDLGSPERFIYYQKPRTTLAFLSRTIEPGFGNLKPDLSVRSDLLPMARELYVGPADRLAGMVPNPPGDQWPAAVITAPSRSFDAQ